MSGHEVIAVVVGVRPEIIKMAPVVHALVARQVKHVVLYTNQHALPDMSTVFFEAMGYQPDWRPSVGFFPGQALDALIQQLWKVRATTVICQGDTTTTLMAALAGIHAGCRVVHLEAGLRSFDDAMLEERHRRAVDHVAHELLTYTRLQSLQLGLESVRGRVTLVGNPMVDVIDFLSPHLQQVALLTARPFLYVTMHRKEFTDDHGRMRVAFDGIAKAAKSLGVDVVFPVHPRTTDRFLSHYDAWPFPTVSPLGIVASLAHVRAAAVVVTDSGGVQEEAAIFGTPCVTIRENTERPETLEEGRNVLASFHALAISDAIRYQIRVPRSPSTCYGATGVGQRVVDVLVDSAVSV